jgi:tetratricopeptide (TPR) repeat protein
MPLLLALLGPSCAPLPAESARCREVKPPVAASALAAVPAPTTTGAAEAPAAPSHCDVADISNIDPVFLEKPVTLRKGVGTVSFKVTTSVKEAQAFFNQGLAYLHSYQRLEAARSFHQALRLDPKLAMAEWGLSRAEYDLRQMKHAEESLARARILGASASPREQRYIALLATQREAGKATGDEKKKKHAAYKAALEKALAEDPADPELWVLRGNTEESDPEGRGQGGKMSSVAFYEAALARDPHHVGAHHYLVHSFENSGRYADAVAHARVYAADAASLPHAQHMLGHVLPRVGGLQEAVKQFEKAESLHDAYERAEGLRPGDDWHRGHNYHLLGHMYLRMGRFPEAEATFRKEVAIPMYIERREGDKSSLIEFLLLRGRAEEALPLARTMAAAPGPGTGPVVGHELETEALLALGRLDEARVAARAADAAVQDLKKVTTREAREMVQYYGDYATQAQAEVDLRTAGPEREKAEKALLDLAEDMAASASIDGWGVGLFWIERIVVEAKRAGRDELAKSLLELMKKIDASYTPGAVSKGAVGTNRAVNASSPRSRRAARVPHRTPCSRPLSRSQSMNQGSAALAGGLRSTSRIGRAGFQG